MPLDPISWMIIGFFVGAAVGYFWDEITAWATQALGYILDAINKAVEITSDAIVYLTKQGTRFYKRIEVYVRNRVTGRTTLKYKEEEIPYVPDEIEEQFRKKTKVPVLQYQT